MRTLLEELRAASDEVDRWSPTDKLLRDRAERARRWFAACDYANSLRRKDE